MGMKVDEHWVLQYRTLKAAASVVRNPQRIDAPAFRLGSTARCNDVGMKVDEHRVSQDRAVRGAASMVRNLQRIDAPAFIGRRPISLRLRLGS